MSYYFKVLKDNPVGFWQLDESGPTPTAALDSSGCENTGVYTGSFNKYFPLSSGGQNSIEINNNNNVEFTISNSYYKQGVSNQFAVKQHSDKEFTLECWVDFKIESDGPVAIVADIDNNIGIFYENKNIVFKLDQEYLEYTLPFINKSIHVVCVYSVNTASIYIDKNLVISKNILSNPFTNSTISFQSGPTNNLSDKFLIDDVAIYTYALSQNQILKHYNNEGYTIPVQIVSQDNGEIFEFQDTEISKVFTYSYPLNKSWQEFANEDVFYNKVNNYISLNKTETQDEKESFLYDTISIPSGISMDFSKIEWFGETGISIETSLDGITYEQCINGESIPGYNYESFSETRLLFVKIRLYSSDTSKYLPSLYNVSFNFYNNQILYSKNGTSYLSKTNNLPFYLGSQKYPILSNDYRNGISIPEDSAFSINLNKTIKSIEFFYTQFTESPNRLVRSEDSMLGAETEYSWDADGIILKTNIASIYINGQNVSSETNINDIITMGNLNHIVINFTDEVSDEVIFGYAQAGSSKSLIQYMALYDNSLEHNKIINHYNLYLNKGTYQAQVSAMTISENSVSLYNNDWIVVQNS